MRKNSMPLPTTISDCFLLQQMGYSTICENGKAAAVVKGRSVDRCVACGDYVSEGRMICLICEKGQTQYTLKQIRRV